MKPYSNITIHHRFSSSVQKEKYLLSYNGQYYEASHAIVALCVSLHLLDIYGYLFVLFPRSLCCFGHLSGR